MTALQCEAFLRQQFTGQNSFYESEFPQAQHSVVTINCESFGRLYVDRRGREIRIFDLAISQKHCGRGIGTKLLGELCSEARDSDRSLRIHIEIHRPRVRDFYTRAGFEAEDESDVGAFLVWTAKG